VGHEELRVGGPDNQHAHVGVGRNFPAQSVELDHEGNVEQVDQRVVDRGPAHPAADVDPQQREILITHTATVDLSRAGCPRGRYRPGDGPS
jgi:hypothetical protein